MKAHWPFGWWWSSFNCFQALRPSLGHQMFLGLSIRSPVDEDSTSGCWNLWDMCSLYLRTSELWEHHSKHSLHVKGIIMHIRSLSETWPSTPTCCNFWYWGCPAACSQAHSATIQISPVNWDVARIVEVNSNRQANAAIASLSECFPPVPWAHQSLECAGAFSCGTKTCSATITMLALNAAKCLAPPAGKDGGTSSIQVKTRG